MVESFGYVWKMPGIFVPCLYKEFELLCTDTGIKLRKTMSYSCSLSFQDKSKDSKSNNMNFAHDESEISNVDNAFMVIIVKPFWHNYKTRRASFIPIGKHHTKEEDKTSKGGDSIATKQLFLAKGNSQDP